MQLISASAAHVQMEKIIILNSNHSYVPIAMHEGSHFEWAQVNMLNLQEPFFRYEVPPHTRRLNTSVAFLVEYGRMQPSQPPAGIIFHMSRCGSTLIMRLLARLRRCVALSEPLLLTYLLASPIGASGFSATELARSVYRSYAALPARSGRKVVVKLTTFSVDALDLPWRRARSAFPSTPFFFVHRNPKVA